MRLKPKIEDNNEGNIFWITMTDLMTGLVLVFIVMFLLPLIHTLGLNCRTINENKECTSCLEGYYLTSNKQCIPCEDPNCKQCSPSSLCLKCFDSFIIKKHKCGKLCDIQFPNCDLCNDDISKCIFCKKGCSLDSKTGQCSCKTKAIIISVCFGIGCVVVGVLSFCLINTKMTHNYAVVNGIPVIKLEEETNRNESMSISKRKKSANVSIEFENVPKSPSIQCSEVNMLSNKEIDTKTPYFEEKIKSSIPKEKNNSSSNNQKNCCDFCLVEPIAIQKQCGCKLCSKHKQLKKMNVKGRAICIVCRAEM